MIGTCITLRASSNIPVMLPAYRSRNVIVGLDPILREALESEAKARSSVVRKVTMSDIIRELIAEHVVAKKSDRMPT